MSPARLDTPGASGPLRDLVRRLGEVERKVAQVRATAVTGVAPVVTTPDGEVVVTDPAVVRRVEALERQIIEVRESVAALAAAGGGGSEVIVLPSAPTLLLTMGTARPTADPAVVVIFRGADPGGNALDGDEWWPA